MRRLLPWIPVVLLALVLTWASALPGLRFARDEFDDTLIRKAGHVVVWAAGTLLAWWAIERTTTLRHAWAWAAGIALAFAAVDELHQAFTLGRESTIRDVAIDGLGVLIALVAGRWWLARRRGADAGVG